MASLAAQQLSSIRKAASGATRSLRNFERAVRALKARVIRATQLEGREAHKRMGSMYVAGFHADNRGIMRRVKKYGPKWAARKKRLGLDLRPGVARKGVIKSVKSPRGFIRTPKGFNIDLEAADITITGRATVGKSKRAIAGRRILAGKGKDRSVVAIGVKFQKTNRRSFRVNNYMGHFVDAKAPGLGTLLASDRKAIDKAGAAAAAEHLASIKDAARKQLTAKALTKLTIRIDKAF